MTYGPVSPNSIATSAGTAEGAVYGKCTGLAASASMNPRFEDPEFRLRFARLVTHYWRNAAFVEDEQLILFELELGASVLREEHAIALLELDGDPLTVVEHAARAQLGRRFLGCDIDAGIVPVAHHPQTDAE